MIINYLNNMPQIEKSVFLAPNSTVIGRCFIGANSSVWFHAVLRGDVNEIRIGQNTNIQDGSVIHCDHDHPVNISDNVTIGHNAIVHGCNIGSNCIIGMGSTILDGAVVGDNCIIGANSLITSGKKIPDGSLVIGSPAKVVRQLTSEEIQSITESVMGYVALSKQYQLEQEV